MSNLMYRLIIAACLAIPQFVTAQIGQTLHFDGVDDYVDVGDVLIDGLPSITVEAWINPNSLRNKNNPTGHNSGEGGILHKAGDDDDNLGLTVSTGGITFYIDNGANQTLQAPAPPIHAWTHVAATYDGSYMRIYTNGSQTAMMPVTGNIINNSNSLRIGGGHNMFGAPFEFHGQLDEIRIWDFARTGAEIQSSMQQELNGHETGLLAYFPLNAGLPYCCDNPGANTAEDMTGNNDGSLNNFELSGCSSNWVPAMLQGAENHPDYAALAAIDQANPGNTMNWDLSACNVCLWNGVFCNANDRVSTLILNNKNIGIIPAEIADLEFLVTLNLRDNPFTSVPAEIAMLSNLKQLSFQNGKLSSLPPEIGDFPVLEAINLNGNPLPYLLPEIGNLTTLKLLELRYIGLTELPATLGNLTNLTGLELRNNNITCLPANMSNLCSNPGLSASVKEGNPIQYTWSQFCNEGLGGDDHPDYEAMLALYEMTNGDNWQNKSGWFSSCDPCNGWYGVNCENGRVSGIVLSQNNLTGSLPVELGELVKLKNLELWGNQIGGSIPASIGNLSDLVYLWLLNNNLTGNIPASIGNLSKLVSLKLEQNSLEGSLPAGLTNLVLLKELNLSDNALAGGLPAAIGDVAALELLNLGDNDLIGTIPVSIGDLSNLHSLNLSDNEMTGPIPASIEQLNNLVNLNLSSNQFSGAVPEGIGNLPLLELLLFNNQLEGCFPSSLSNLCGIFISLDGNPGLPGNGNLNPFCSNGFGGDFDGDSYCGGSEDCDDSDDTVYPGAPELCDGKDNDCDPSTYDPLAILDVEAYHESCSGAADGSIVISAVATSGQIAYSIDGGINFQLTNTFDNLTPGMYEIVVKVLGGQGPCEKMAVANLLDGPSPQDWYKDLDGDGYSDGIVLSSCVQPSGYKLLSELVAAPVGADVDCDDNDAAAYPGQIWWKDMDGDGYTDGASTTACIPIAGYVLYATPGDCNDSDASVFPGAVEICNGIDDNCDGSIDEGLSGLTYSGSVTFYTQAAVNEWMACYAVIDGDLTIMGGDIVDLGPLNALTEVTGNLTIAVNAALTTLDGLELLDNVGGDFALYYNFMLTDCCAALDLINGGVGGTIIVFFNGTGCQNVADINTSCANPMVENPAGNTMTTGASLEAKNKLKLYPNPASRAVNIALEGIDGPAEIQMYDHFGRIVWEQKIDESTTQLFRLDRKSVRLVKGQYFVKLKTQDYSSVQQLIIID